jgi:hypothetical protein
MPGYLYSTTPPHRREDRADLERVIAACRNERRRFWQRSALIVGNQLLLWLLLLSGSRYQRR